MCVFTTCCLLRAQTAQGAQSDVERVRNDAQRSLAEAEAKYVCVRVFVLCE